MPDFAIIGGTGMERLPPEFTLERIGVATRFGAVHVSRAMGPDSSDVIFLSRHGEEHSLAPHDIDYRANIAALVELGITRVLATNAVGSLRTNLLPDSIVLIDDFIDFTRARQLSYWDSRINPPPEVTHTDFSTPYCPVLRRAVLEAAREQELQIDPRGTYVCVDGPRYESPAEVRMFAQMGGDVVGMTGLPEAVFAREAGLCYAAVCVVTNLGAGLACGHLAHGDVVKSMRRGIDRVRTLLMAVAKQHAAERTCNCQATHN